MQKQYIYKAELVLRKNHSNVKLGYDINHTLEEHLNPDIHIDKFDFNHIEDEENQHRRITIYFRKPEKISDVVSRKQIKTALLLCEEITQIIGRDRIIEREYTMEPWE